MREPTRLDAAVVGAGAVGASAALHLARLGFRVAVLEKEEGPARHQSGRSSGVVHAGYNLKPGTEKARFCRDGNRELKEWCRSHGVPLAELGAFVVARDESEAGTLRELERRAKANGVAARIVDRERLVEAEPHADGILALHAPEVASFDAPAYVASVVAAAQAEGVEFRWGARVQAIEETSAGVRLATSAGPVDASVAVNAAGLHADRLAARLAPDLRIVPFRGTYAEIVPGRRDLVRTHLYPTPDLAFPFLGVHLSRRTDGRVMVGPGAMLALGREAYSAWHLHLRDMASMASWPGFWRLLAKSEVRRLVGRELRKSLDLGAVANEAARLVPELQASDLVPAMAGNRAQLVARDGALVDDIVVREGPSSVHVLNAVSPGLTCSLPFGRHLAALAAGKMP
ncbi:MAG: L-2-hydroxyglutarate oxidase [Thermoplasmatota archaeon]